MPAQWRHLSIDITPYECDPEFLQRLIAGGMHASIPEDIETTGRFDRLAGRIHDFTTATRGFLPVIWANSCTHQEVQMLFPQNRMIYEMEGRPHGVEWLPGDLVLDKTESSVHSEHILEFDQMKREGTKGFTMSGVSFSACVTFSALPLLFEGFKIVILEDLVDDRRPQDASGARRRLSEMGAVFMNSAQIVQTRGQILDRLLTTQPEINPPGPL